MRYISIIIFIIVAFTSCTKNSVQYQPTIPMVTTNQPQAIKPKPTINTTLQIEASNTTLNQTPYKSFVNLEQNSTMQEENIDQLALIIPSTQIGKYAKEAVNISNIYLLYKNKPIKLKVFDIINQNQKSLEAVLNSITKEHITNIIAMVTSKNFPTLNNLDLENKKIYLPLVNKSEIKSDIKSNFIFGGISYEAQFKKLLEYVNYKKIVNFYDNSAFGYELYSYIKKYPLRYNKKIDNNNRYYSKFLKRNKKLRGSNILLNTPIVKSSILLSQIDGYSIPISHILSTQINYTPLIFSLTQKSNRKLSIIIANSIGYIPEDLLEYSSLANSNLQYNWVNYSIIVGIEYLTEKNIKIFKDIDIKDNQVIYPVYLYKVRYYSFRKLG